MTTGRLLPDASGSPSSIRTHLIAFTTIGLDINKRKCIIADDETGATSKAGVYAGGDAVTGAATVILAMGAGKAAAKGIDEFIKNKAK